MIEHSLYKACGLIIRSKKETAIYIAAALASAWLYVFTCGLLGVDGAYVMDEAMKSSPAKACLAYLPGLLLMAWFSAGLTGRVTVHAAGGEAAGLARYANAWYLRKAGWDFLYISLTWVAMWFMSVKFFGYIFVSSAWLIAAIWLSLRVALWLNIGIIEGLGILEAAKRSYALMRGRVWQLIIISAFPMVVAKALAMLINKLAASPAGLAYYVGEFFSARLPGLALTCLLQECLMLMRLALTLLLLLLSRFQRSLQTERRYL